MSVKDKLKSIKFPKVSSVPVWKGPEEDGITFSLLSRFLCCRERFRLMVIEGLKPDDHFNHRLEFGNMWHVCEETYAKYKQQEKNPAWEGELGNYVHTLLQKYPMQREDVVRWYETCRVMFPIYVEYWRKNPDVVGRTPLLQEQVFDVPYKLPSGRTVRLRGKWDSVDLIGKGKAAGVYLQENKTKSDIDEQSIRRQLTFDLQTMMYLAALYEFKKECSDPDLIKLWDHPIAGVRYNVVRRPRQYQGKKETQDQFLDRLRGIIEDSPDEFFMRWKVEISQADVETFRRDTLDPILESLCNWWMVQTGLLAGTQARQDYLVNYGHHWRHPFGVYNVLDEGGHSDLDEYLATGSETGLQRTTNLFPELT